LTDQPPILLAAAHVSKRFGTTQALDDVSVSFLRGEVHALMGENGAGKSTLGKIIAGLYRQDSGTVTIDGHALRPGDLNGAFHAGVRLVHQELAQCPNLTVAENLSLHDIPTRFGLVNRRAMIDRAARLVHKLDPGIDVRSPLGLLSPGRRQICQIAAALDERTDGRGGASGQAKSAAKVIVLDEPTSSLSIAEADRLLAITRQLAAEGITIIYVSHRMGEIFAVCDRVTVLRDGKFIATSRVKDIDEPALVEQMIGRRLEAPIRRAAAVAPAAENAGEAVALRQLAGSGQTHTPGATLLEVRDLSSRRLDRINFSVRAGEVVGIGGLVGCGRSELLDAVFGLDPTARGEVLVGGKPLPLASPRQAIAAGIGYVPEDRRLQGLFFQLGVGENIILPLMSRLAMAMGVRRGPRERSEVNDRMAHFRVKAASPSSLPGELSGGNQQKLLIARWMNKDTRLLLLDEPTRGIDVGTKAEVYRLIQEAAQRGAAIVLVSSEMPELLALSDRILVMCNGRISGELAGEAMTQANILRLATVNSAPRPVTT
jgi:ABC-type sugar transport system ATPase subunit